MAQYCVKRAVILAAGLGERMAPITTFVPKPLVRVNGKRIIDTILDALLQADIREIYVVCGYLAEKFAELQQDYPMIRLIKNSAYREANNIFSVICVGNLVENAYIIEGDLFLNNMGLITTYQMETNYLAIPVKKTKDWCFFLGKDGYIQRLGVGGENCEQMVGISYWTAEDGRRLASRAKAVYHTAGGAEKYWDQIALEAYISEFHIRVRECSAQDVVEIDTFEELKALDPSYR